MYKLLSHNDLDGVGCGILAKLAFGNNVSVRYNSVGGLNREVEYFLDNEDKDTFLFITDLSVNEKNQKRLEEFYQENGKLQFIDHHKTALHFNEYSWGHVVVEEEEGRLASATSLFYDYLTANQFLTESKAIGEFVELVRQYDTWEWEKNENDQAQRLNALFYLVSIDEFEATMVERLKDSEHFYFEAFEEKILDMEEDKMDRYIRKKRRELIQKKVNNYYTGIVFAESYHSELGNQLGKDYPHLDYITILNMGGRRLGFRTIHDHVDVSEIASEYKGGGHRKASGGTMTERAFKVFVQETYPLEPLREDAKRNRYNVKDSDFGTLYYDRMDSSFFIYSKDERWFIKQDGTLLNKEFSTFHEAENYIKRKNEAWLVRDEVFVQYLMNKVKK